MPPERLIAFGGIERCSNGFGHSSRKDATAMKTIRPETRIAASLLFVACTVVVTCHRASAQYGQVKLASSTSGVNHQISQSVERLEMLVKSSQILTVEERIPKFQVHNEEVIGATPVSQNQLQIYAKAPGTTQLNIWDTNDKQYTVDITVIADAREVEGILSSQLPLASLKVMPVNSSAIISGYVTSVDDVDRAVAIVEQFYTTVVNNIKVVGVQQVLLHTRIMEVSRTKLRDLGVDWGVIDGDSFFFSGPSGFADINNSSLLGLQPSATGVTNRLFVNGGDFEALIQALRQQDLVKMLAEPTVVATHGRPARFTVGGKVPYIVPAGDNAVSINYEEFGTSVDFLPFVVGPGRIRLEVRPEVKEPDDTRSIEAAGISVPGFTQRYVETAVELQAGQTFAIAGLLQSRTEAFTRATPLLGELPYLGVMFRRTFQRRNDIELLITVTPELVDAMDPHEVPRGGPGLNSTNPNDCEMYLDGHIEVPNLLGGDGCTSYADGYSTMPPCQPTGPHDHVHPMPPGSAIPPGAIVPSSTPAVVGEGVIVTQPES
jgi:pilus assembly protein CpaC